MDKSVKNIIESILGIRVSDNIDEITPENIEEWDSLNHLNIILGLEEEFDIIFNGMEIFDMMEGYERICETVKRKLNKEIL